MLIFERLLGRDVKKVRNPLVGKSERVQVQIRSLSSVGRSLTDTGQIIGPDDGDGGGLYGHLGSFPPYP